ncbi:MAG: hypothetical protein K1X88_12255 [Nannocystaceae bacterium]|nr:hypothetical protein [Nannocystaceae bacterium]
MTRAALVATALGVLACTPAPLLIGNEPSGSGGGEGSDSASTGGEGDADAPVVWFVDVVRGATVGGPDDLGVPITIFGHGFGDAPGSVTIGGVEVARVLAWGEPAASGAETIVVQPGSQVQGGAVVVHTAGGDSNDDAHFTAGPHAVYFVAQGGDDAAACDEAAPCATILHVVTEVMQPGDMVLLSAGDHDEGEIWIRDALGHSGTADAPKVIRGAPGETVRLIDVSRPFIVEAQGITISGLDFTSGKELHLGSADARAVTVMGCRFGGVVGFEAVTIAAQQVLFGANACAVAGTTAADGNGHCVAVRSPADAVALLHNALTSAQENVIQIYDANPGATIGTVRVEANLVAGSRAGSGISLGSAGDGASIGDVDIANNVITGNAHIGVSVDGAAGTQLGVARLWANTIAANGRQGLRVGAAATAAGIDVRGNLLLQDGAGTCDDTECDLLTVAEVEIEAGASPVVAGNFYADGEATIIGGTDADARAGSITFGQDAEDPWRPAADAACVDTAAAIEVATDFDGRARPQGGGYDFGAFER